MHLQNIFQNEKAHRYECHENPCSVFVKNGNTILEPLFESSKAMKLGSTKVRTWVPTKSQPGFNLDSNPGSTQIEVRLRAEKIFHLAMHPW